MKPTSRKRKAVRTMYISNPLACFLSKFKKYHRASNRINDVKGIHGEGSKLVLCGRYYYVMAGELGDELYKRADN